MRAADFDFESEPRGDLPDGLDEWPVPVPFNRLNDGKPDHVILDVRVTASGHVVVEEMPIRDERTGGLEGRFGDWTPSDVNSGPMADYQPDMRDQLQNNPIGGGNPSFEYEVYGRTISEADFPNGAPADPDLGVDEVVAWAKARGDGHFAGIMERIRDEQP